MISRPLLLLSCSARKRSDTNDLPTLERYDGPAFRVVRRFKRDFPTTNVETFVLSAKFGLLSADELVPLYDQPLDLSTSGSLKGQVQKTLCDSLCDTDFSPIFVDVSTKYRPVLGEIEKFFPISVPLQWAQGAPGMRAAQLRAWLHRLVGVDNEDKASVPIAYNISDGLHEAKFCGRTVSVAPEQVHEIATSWHKAPSAQKRIPSLWYVAIDLPSGITIVPLKWLVSRIVELPHNAFSTSQATSFLKKIGLKNAIFSRALEFED